MKDEIKKILDTPIFIIDDEGFTVYINDKINNYITNLQQSDTDKQLEIMKLKDRLEKQRKEYQETYKDVRIEIKEKNNTITNLQQENERLKAKYDNNKSHEVNYKYFTTLYSKATKDIVIDDLVYKCEDLDNLRQSYEKLYIEKEDYKSRFEKANEYLDKVESLARLDGKIIFSINIFRDILQNGGDILNGKR